MIIFFAYRYHGRVGGYDHCHGDYHRYYMGKEDIFLKAYEDIDGFFGKLNTLKNRVALFLR